MTNFNQETLNKAYENALLYCAQNSIDRTYLLNDSQTLHGFIANIYPQNFLIPYILYTLLYNIDMTIFEFEGYVSSFIKTTEEYQRLTTLYDEYITLIAELIKETYDEIFDVAAYYTKLLHNGIFSYNCEFNYKKLKIDFGHRLDMLGARIASGFGVCRHIAMNLKDIYNKLDYNAAFLICGLYDNKIDFQNQPKKHVIRTTPHAIVGVTNSKNSLIVDPTMEAVGRFDYPKKDIVTIKRFDAPKNKFSYANIDPELIAKGDKEDYDNYINFLSHNNYFDNNLDNLTQRYTDISLRIHRDLLYYKEWNAKHQDLFKEVAELEKLLSCYKEIEVVRTRR